eukprot:255572_1
MNDVAESISHTDPRRRTKNCVVGKTIDKYAKLVNEKMQENNPLNHHLYEQNPISSSSIRKRTRPPNLGRNVATEWYINPNSNIKFRKPQNSHSNKNKGAHFCLGKRKYVDTVAAMNASEVLYISLDNKSRAGIGVTLANKQGKLLGVSELRISDHDFPYGSSHSLIISCYRILVISPNGYPDDHKRVSGSGETLVCIRSAYHWKDCAFNHADDIQRIIDNPIFNEWTRNEKNELKSILILEADTGPDEAHRNNKVQLGHLKLMKDNQFDTIVGNNSCTGQSKNNRVERGMVEVTKCFIGQSLEVFTYGEHLKNGIVIDDEMCRKNFGAAIDQMVKLIDGHKVDGYTYHAIGIPPLNEQQLKARDDLYYANDLLAFQTPEHFTGGYNYVQFVNCRKPETCSAKICTNKEFKSNITRTFPSVFISPPIVFDNSKLTLVNPTKLPNKYHFAPLNFIQTQKIKLPPNFHHDTYNEFFEDKEKLLKKK